MEDTIFLVFTQSPGFFWTLSHLMEHPRLHLASTSATPDVEQNQNLINGLVAGDATAASAFHRQFGKRISRLVWRLLGADAEHDDVVNQVYVNILRSIRTLRQPERLQSWITGVVINTVRKEIHKRKLRRIFQLSADIDENRLGWVNPEEKLFLQRFYFIVDQMRTEVRLVFILHFIEDYSLAEIAGLFKFSVPTAKRRLQAGRVFFIKKAQGDAVISGWVERLVRERVEK
jgi:RNA polymerase sigma-70 factor (ECF subfamily)